MFNFSRRASNGSSLPTWLATPGPVFLRKFVRNSKFEPIVEKVDLLMAIQTVLTLDISVAENLQFHCVI